MVVLRVVMMVGVAVVVRLLVALELLGDLLGLTYQCCWEHGYLTIPTEQWILGQHTSCWHWHLSQNTYSLFICSQFFHHVYTRL